MKFSQSGASGPPRRLSTCNVPRGCGAGQVGRQNGPGCPLFVIPMKNSVLVSSLQSCLAVLYGLYHHKAGSACLLKVNMPHLSVALRRDELVCGRDRSFTTRSRQRPWPSPQGVRQVASSRNQDNQATFYVFRPRRQRVLGPADPSSFRIHSRLRAHRFESGENKVGITRPSIPSPTAATSECWNSLRRERR